MAHVIGAYIARRPTFRQAGLRCPIALVDLPQKLAIQPLTLELWSWIHGSEDPERLRYAGVRLSRWSDADDPYLKRLSRDSTVAYIETDYHGGDGEQSAVVARDGDIVYGPRRAPHGPINAALRYLGVRLKGKDLDEFDTLGLRRFRDNGDLVRAYFLRDWLRAYFVLPESSISDFERAGRRQTSLRSELGPGGLYSCPVDEPPENVVESFLIEEALAVHSFELSIEEHWMISNFYRIRRGVETEPARFAELGSALFTETDVQFSIWSAQEARQIAHRLTVETADRREFADFYPYDIPGAHPPDELIKAFPEKVRMLRDCFTATPPGAVGVLAEV